MNILIPFRNTCGDKEIQMCIKLIRKNLYVPYNEIYVYGDECNIPGINNIIIEEQKYNKWLDSSFLVHKYIEAIGEPFILFNDDFFLTDKVNNIPYLYYSTLSNRILTTNIINPKTNMLKQSAYGLNIVKFIDTIGDYDNYEVHIPMIIESPSTMDEAIRLSKELDCPALKRTLYMKLMEDKGIQYEKIELEYDCKFGEPLKIMQYPFFSLTDDAEFKVFEKDLAEIAK